MRLDRLQLALTGALAGTCLVSVFAAQVLLTLGVVVFFARLALRRTSFPRLATDAPIVAFAVWTLLSASFSADPLRSHESAKKLVLFLVLYLVADAVRSPAYRERLIDGVLLGGLVLGAGSLLQYHFLGFDTLHKRPHSFLGHYMTASGLSMGVLVLATTRLVFRAECSARPTARDLKALGVLAVALGGLTFLQAAELFALEAERLLVAALALATGALALSRGPWPGASTQTLLGGLAAAVSAGALIVSRTRNAWVGAVAGLAVLALLRAPRTLLLIPVGLLAVLALRPAPIMERLTVFDASSRDRYYMWQAGIDMILDKPVFGQGPNMIFHSYPSYRWPEAPNPLTPHLHDNLLQIAAERGLPCLAWWLWLMAVAFLTAYREAGRPVTPETWPAAAALAGLTALMAAGLFEYNFGDSEVLMFTLLLMALPFGLWLQGRSQLPLAPEGGGATADGRSPSSTGDEQLQGG